MEIILLTWFAAAAMVSANIDELNIAAVKAYKAGDCGTAEKLSLRALAECSNDAGYQKTIKGNLALIYRKMNRIGDAEKLEKESMGTSDLVFGNNQPIVLPNPNKSVFKATESFEALTPVDAKNVFTSRVLLTAVSTGLDQAKADFPSITDVQCGHHITCFIDRKGNKYLHLPYVLTSSNGLAAKDVRYILTFDAQGNYVRSTMMDGISQTTEKHRVLEKAAREIDDEERKLREAKDYRDRNEQAKASQAAHPSGKGHASNADYTYVGRSYSSRASGGSGSFGDGHSWYN